LRTRKPAARIPQRAHRHTRGAAVTAVSFSLGSPGLWKHRIALQQASAQQQLEATPPRPCPPHVPHLLRSYGMSHAQLETLQLRARLDDGQEAGNRDRSVPRSVTAPRSAVVTGQTQHAEMRAAGPRDGERGVTGMCPQLEHLVSESWCVNSGPTVAALAASCPRLHSLEAPHRLLTDADLRTLAAGASVRRGWQRLRAAAASCSRCGS
jgi:hypothetical protein